MRILQNVVFCKTGVSMQKPVSHVLYFAEKNTGPFKIKLLYFLVSTSLEPNLHPSSLQSFFSCIPPFIHTCFPVSFHPHLLFCILAFLHPLFPASLLSCIPSFLHPSFPASLLSCIPPFLHSYFPASFQSYN